MDITIVLTLVSASIVAGFAGWLIYLQRKAKAQETIANNKKVEGSQQLQLQAYERLAMLVERTHPRQLIPRVYTSGMTVQELQQALVMTINAEFEHNLSQQIYVTASTWQLIRIFKEQEINMIKHIASTINPSEPASILHQQIVNYLITTESETPSETAMQAIQAEAKSLLTQGI